jgi:DNA-binding NarL/FixJ family response regulator
VTTVAAIVPDLMDRSRIDAALPSVRYVAAVDALGTIAPDLVIADLTRVSDVDELRRAVPAARIIAFVPHVDDAVISKAEQAGCDDVMPRSVFFRRLPTLLD